MRTVVLLLLTLGLTSCATNTITKESTKLAVQSQLPAVRECYLNANEKARKILSGEVSFAWTVDADGKAQEVRIKKDNIYNDNLNNCVMNVIRTVPFPKPKVGDTVTVSNYPFVFRP